jgi:ubiquinone/menaquinone biosynthesis C-methylase UbiE
MAISLNLRKKLRCTKCPNQKLEFSENEIKCPKCNSIFKIKSDIPSFSGVYEQDWNPWKVDKTRMMGDSYYKRAKGELPEKEASKSYARFLKKYYKKGDQILDLGCATGHFLRSFRKLLDKETDYTGIDTDPQYLLWGKEVFGVGEKCNFVNGDVLNMPFKDNSYDIIVVNLFHFFPNIKDALGESIRVANKYIVWRTPIGVVNSVFRLIYNQDFDEIGVLTPERDDIHNCLYMLYSKKYLKGLVKNLGAEVVEIHRDTDFGEFDNNKLEGFEEIPGTRVVNDMQMNCNIHLDWSYVVIKI